MHFWATHLKDQGQQAEPVVSHAHDLGCVVRQNIVQVKAEAAHPVLAAHYGKPASRLAPVERCRSARPRRARAWDFRDTPRGRGGNLLRHTVQSKRGALRGWFVTECRSCSRLLGERIRVLHLHPTKPPGAPAPTVRMDAAAALPSSNDRQGGRQTTHRTKHVVIQRNWAYTLRNCCDNKRR